MTQCMAVQIYDILIPIEYTRKRATDMLQTVGEVGYAIPTY